MYAVCQWKCLHSVVRHVFEGLFCCKVETFMNLHTLFKLYNPFGCEVQFSELHSARAEGEPFSWSWETRHGSVQFLTWVGKSIYDNGTGKVVSFLMSSLNIIAGFSLGLNSRKVVHIYTYYMCSILCYYRASRIGIVELCRTRHNYFYHKLLCGWYVHGRFWYEYTRNLALLCCWRRNVRRTGKVRGARSDRLDRQIWQCVGGLDAWWKGSVKSRVSPNEFIFSW